MGIKHTSILLLLIMTLPALLSVQCIVNILYVLYAKIQEKRRIQKFQDKYYKDMVKERQASGYIRL